MSSNQGIWKGPQRTSRLPRDREKDVLKPWCYESYIFRNTSRTQTTPRITSTNSLTHLTFCRWCIYLHDHYDACCLLYYPYTSPAWLNHICECAISNFECGRHIFLHLQKQSYALIDRDYRLSNVVKKY